MILKCYSIVLVNGKVLQVDAHRVVQGEQFIYFYMAHPKSDCGDICVASVAISAIAGYFLLEPSGVINAIDAKSEESSK